MSLGKKRDIPANVFTKCPLSGSLVFTKELEKDCMVVSCSGYHFPIGARDRMRLLLDEGTFVEMDTELQTVDPLEFTVPASYVGKIAENRKKTGLDEAAIGGTGKLDGIDISIAAMDFRFLGGSMGSVVGERIGRAIGRGVSMGVPVVIVCASGGARMYEGMLSLMQMAKSAAALARLRDACQPYVAVLTNPTMAGAIASFASLGDIILAEPGALIGFAGPRVIRETTRQELPDGFQTSEFLLERGLIDQIVDRRELKGRIGTFLRAFGAKSKKTKSSSSPCAKN
ncbi:MAG: acetyl-CoA carboxylase, carboxyltransferase subunit beta [Puniceicoccales bacterium]|nr:acetyl-CoA carboxylase, carboxyltransferase subunit beta [Puniceicoccales bacterium]